MKKLSSSDVPQRDRLSELPDSLILEILSLLPMRDVVRTTFLSKRWKDLWTTVPFLDFTDDDDINNSGRLQNFVNRAVNLWKGAKILKFKINFFYYGSSRDVDLWVRFATKNEVEELDVRLMDVVAVELGYDSDYCLPQCLYSCSSIKKLSLVGCNLEIKGNVQWNQLKSLRIDGVQVSEHDIDQVLSGAPQLEILMLRVMESYENVNIQSSSLKKLMIEKYLGIDNDPAEDTVLRIWAPNLETLEIAGVPYNKCFLVNISSLIDATLDFNVRMNYDDDFPWDLLVGETLRLIFPTIRHVEKVTLSECCIEVFGVIEKKYLLSSSLDAKFLKIKASFVHLEEIVFLLENFPKLEMFFIERTEDLLDKVDYQTFREKLFEEEQKYYLKPKRDLPESFLLQLRKIEITWLLCEASIFPFIEFMFQHASMLEKVVIRGRRIKSLAPESVFVGAALKIRSMQRSFPTAELILCEN